MSSKAVSTAAAAALAPVVSMPRRHTVGGENTRGLLFTILGELVLPTGGSAWTAAYIEILSRFGIEEKASRQVLKRTGEDGWLQTERVGRRTSWRLTASAEDVLTSGTERIFGFKGAQHDWDGSWVFVLARVPETERAARHLVRTRLAWAGFGSPLPGLWISTHPDRTAEVERVLVEAGLTEDAQVFLSRHAEVGSPAGLVSQAWNLIEIEASYRDFIERFSPASSREPLTRLIELVHAWRRFPTIDPALPVELLPDGWSGVAAARLFDRRHASLVAPARAEWAELNQG